MINSLKKIFILIMPWSIKRILLQKLMGYQIHKTAKIGYAWFFPEMLIMGPNSKIGHLNTAIHLDKVIIGENSSISRGNWITGFPSNTNSKHFAHQPERKSILEIGNHSAITKNHHLDCTNHLKIGNYVTVAGYQSQFLTHSINVMDNRQDSAPIFIGDYCFIGTNSVILGGSQLPSKCVLGAKSLLNKKYTEESKLYGGVPARKISDIPEDAKYFSRSNGFVV